MSEWEGQTFDAATEEAPGQRARRGGPEDDKSLALLILWAAQAPERVGQVLFLRRDVEKNALFGRGKEAGEGDYRLNPMRQIPGDNREMAPMALRRLSRAQWRIFEVSPGRFTLENLGRAPLLHCGEAVSQITLAPGMILAIKGQLLFQVVERMPYLAALPSLNGPIQPLGQPCFRGLVGEGPAIWSLRNRLDFVRARQGHILIAGPSGSGKELVARAIHGDENTGPWVSRNAATIPESLLDAELFGHVENYPNMGMAARAGLVGLADGGTLFLDEIGELPEAMQAHLLRLMDDGEYQRLGEAHTRQSDFRLLGATNRDIETLKPDILARFRHVIDVPGLDERREDIPLLIQHLLREALPQEGDLLPRFIQKDGPEGLYFQVDCALIEGLIGHPLELNIRQLNHLLWQAIAQSPGDTILAPAGLKRHQNSPLAPSNQPLPGPEAVQESLIRHDYIQSRVWRDLGLANRYVLRRLIKKYNLKTQSDD